MDALIAELKQKVVEVLNLEELSAEEINENTSLELTDWGWTLLMLLS